MTSVKFWKEDETTQVRAEAAIHDGAGTIVRHLFFRERSQLPIRMDVWDLPPGASEGDHTHGQEEALEEIYYCLSGEGQLLIEGEAAPIRPGEAVLVPPGVDHGLYNTGAETLRVLLIWGKPANAQG